MGGINGMQQYLSYFGIAQAEVRTGYVSQYMFALPFDQRSFSIVFGIFSMQVLFARTPSVTN